ncbi:MAG TPA: imidazole glycerol phosphate synthase subunit HisF [Candidatus Blautia stercoravium]|nr:imidazole glycerol phosphate synthase subunit HisF [Candidatus Blautia stercoravium]
MLAKRIIPCLDVRDGKVVKGIHFVGIREVGDPVEYAIEYDRQGADEICFLDITATHEGRKTMVDVVRKTAENVFVPLTVGGGIRSVEDFREILRAGADKVAVNSAAVDNPHLIRQAAEVFGSQCVVAAIDAKRDETGAFHVVVHGGRKDTGLDAVWWAKECERLGAGEILLTSMDADGAKEGFDLELLRAVCGVVSIPVIASGGCGKIEHFSQVFEETGADAALAASLFHYKELTVDEVKAHLEEHKIPVRRQKKMKEIEEYFTKADLLPAIVQEAETGEVLMLAYMNRESFQKTLETGYTWFYSRSRQELWNKGATSGHVQKVVDIKGDCDKDTVLITVVQTGAACHTGAHSCFFREIGKEERL